MSAPYRGFVEDRIERRRRLLRRLLVPLLMAAFGIGVYTALGHLRRLDAAAISSTRSATGARVDVELSGTLVFAQNGDLYRLRGTDITALLAHTPRQRWMQPAPVPDGGLVAVSRGAQSSDLVEVDPDGAVVRRLTTDAGLTQRDGSLANNHWAFHPRVAPDGTVWYDYDAPKDGYRVDLAVWNRPLSAGATVQGRRWSTPHDYTGGDVEPLPLPQGGVILVRYAVDDQLHIRAELWLQRTLRDPGRPLTTLADDCGQPDLAPDGTMLAMVCTGGGQSGRLEVASFDGSRLGTPRVVASGCLCAVPTWSPDGSGLAYIAPGAAGDGFDLWWIAGVASGAAPPSPARQVVEGLSLDATSRPVWTR